ncbi:enoyl-CoA hydratase/isomerase family protein [Streptomyces rugosispiralis]|uniref:3-hydroxyisobutyryl-CoA hydrolase n=1 Tax=Streptomyces rugosispiralis TaxID=2967341 RepID=A0ABT1UNN9_9ACTN|nr:enoyl-CoA hydratase/isomerase family protein [Streptomyces rugosispiralis]MCQ8186747.1 enoyl-CoA hydratase/isomerase family protein [Streptomyces rugosispiralis]
MTATTTRIRAEVRAGLGDLALDRPEALNALTPDMVAGITRVLSRWADDDTVHTVVVRSTSPRAFCAGGDIRFMREEVLAQRLDQTMAFFADEYALNEFIASYPKPYVALLDGVAMGGGLGLSVHGGYRVVTEHSVLAMPETSIGFFPDVGASYFLPRLAPGWGRYLGLTGARVDAGGALRSGLATHYVPREHLDDLVKALTRKGISALDGTHGAPPALDPPGAAPAAAVLKVFGETPLAELEAELRVLTDPQAEAALAALLSASPSSVVTTDRLLCLGAQSSLSECLARELATARDAIRRPDFDEGVRRAVVERGTTPVWSHATIEDAAAEDADAKGGTQ